MTAYSPPPGGVAPGRPAIELVSVAWRRVQVLLRCRAAGTSADLRTLHLRRVGGHGPAMGPTGWEREGDEIVLRFFAYDLEEYVGSRDFYEPYESFVPGRIVRTFDELLDAIRRDDYQLEKVAPFASRHLDHLDGGSTDRVIDLILSP